MHGVLAFLALNTKLFAILDFIFLQLLALSYRLSAIFMDEHHLKLLKELSVDNTLSQRDLSKKLGLSLGKVNYVLNALLDKGLVKAKRFKNSRSKLAYMYILTPKGITKKMDLTYHFLKQKIDEYDTLRTEIEELKRELGEVKNG